MNFLPFAFLPFAQGIGLGAAMLIPIGAQNSYVLNQSIKRNNHIIAAIICVLFDMSFMAIGVYGGAVMLNEYSLLMTIITWAGAAFLLCYGFTSIKAGIKRTNPQSVNDDEQKSLKVVVLTTLAVTLLNPHVYLDTVVIVGSVSAQFQGSDKTGFAVGIMLASALWFSCLTLGGAKMSTLLSRPKVRASIDIFMGLLMWFIAVTLIF